MTPGTPVNHIPGYVDAMRGQLSLEIAKDEGTLKEIRERLLKNRDLLRAFEKYVGLPPREPDDVFVSLKEEDEEPTGHAVARKAIDRAIFALSLDNFTAQGVRNYIGGARADRLNLSREKIGMRLWKLERAGKLLQIEPGRRGSLAVYRVTEEYLQKIRDVR